jgi:hypothetical protein
MAAYLPSNILSRVPANKYLQRHNLFPFNRQCNARTPAPLSLRQLGTLGVLILKSSEEEARDVPEPRMMS